MVEVQGGAPLLLPISSRWGDPAELVAHCLGALWGFQSRGRFPNPFRCLRIGWSVGYGSIPINTIFSGMNIHLPAILGFTRYQGFDPSPVVSSWNTLLQWSFPELSWTNPNLDPTVTDFEPGSSLKTQSLDGPALGQIRNIESMEAGPKTLFGWWVSSSFSGVYWLYMAIKHR